jgi:hypothetical protein
MRSAAATVIFATGVLHSLLGELLILRHLPRMQGFPVALGNDLLAKRTVHFTWHLATVFAFALAVIVLASGDRYLLDVISDAMFGASLVIAVISRALHPGWIALLAAGILLRL